MKKKLLYFRRMAEELTGVDKVVRHKDATFSLKRGFFYRHGMDSDKWANTVSVMLKKKKVDFEIVSSHEHWAAWPKDSYFVVRIKVIDYCWEG